MLDGHDIKKVFLSALSSMNNENNIQSPSQETKKDDIPKFGKLCVHHINVIPYEEYCISNLGKHFICLLNTLKWKSLIEVKKFKDIILYEICELTLNKSPEIILEISKSVSSYLENILTLKDKII